MRILNLIILLCFCLVLQAKSIKVNYKGQIRPFSITIEKIEFNDSGTVVHAKLRQQQNFSYGVSFSDCYIITPSSLEPIRGMLQTWNDEENVKSVSKPMSDGKDEKFTLYFPSRNLTGMESFDIKVGNIEDRKKTELIFKGITLKKK